MESNLDKIAKDLYGKISVRFPDITIGDENAEVLSKKADIPRARFFEFEYTEKGQPLGTIAITLDEDDGIVIQISGELSEVKSSYYNAYKFLRSFRKFAKARLLNFDIQNIGKSNLDKRDYQFQAKHKELAIMENKMFGTGRISYQSLGEARLIIKHSQPINPEVAAGRTRHIKSIHIENAEGERFKYPYKHLHGARALAEHIKHGGTPYDAIGKHITNLSEELAQLRKFKQYVGNKQQVSESMGGITDKVIERISEVKKQVLGLQRGSYYEQFAESFSDTVEKIIPESVMNDWIDRLTVRTFNEEMKSVFPYLYNILDESELPVVELSVDDIMDEGFGREALSKSAEKAGVSSKHWEKVNPEQAARHAKADAEMAERDREWREKFGKKTSPEDKLESFLEGIVNEDRDELFSPLMGAQNRAMKDLNTLLASEMVGGVPGVMAFKGIIDDPEFTNKIAVLDSDAEVRDELKSYILDNEPKVLPYLTNMDITNPLGIGGVTNEPSATPGMGEQPPAPMETPPTATPPEMGEQPPVPGTETLPPISESLDKKAKMKARFIKAKNAGAKLDTKFAEGMTILDAIMECGLDPEECGYNDASESGIDQLLKIISGFWNKEERNFTIGNQGVKNKIEKAVDNGDCPNASDDDIRKVFLLVDKKDPGSDEHTSQIGAILKLAGVQEQPEITIIKTDDRGDDLKRMASSMMEGALMQIKRNAGLL